METDDFYSQVHFTGESSCPKFVPNKFRGSFCTACSKEISKHKKDSVKDKEVLIKALEYTQSKEKMGTLIISTNENDGNVGSLYLGGYPASITREFIGNKHITHMLNMAANLASFFGPKYQNSVTKIVNDFGIDYLSLNWEDSDNFNIPMDELIKGVTFIHEALKTGNIFVHCAQGKSRSSTIVVAYIMAYLNLTCDKALEVVQEKTKMAQPNPGFIKFLSTLNEQTEFVEFKSTISNS